MGRDWTRVPSEWLAVVYDDRNEVIITIVTIIAK
jgi:hypothetical protein